jgi:hypothetical protein
MHLVFIFLCFLLWKRKEYFAAAFCYSNSASFPREGRRNHQSITRRQDISTPEREGTGGGGKEMLPAIGGKEINVKLLQAFGQLEPLRATAAPSSWPDVDLGDA